MTRARFKPRWQALESDEKALHTGLSSTLERILAARGMDESDIDAFLNPSLRNERMRDQELIADRIMAAIGNNLPIQIFGDYDVDGLSSSALLYNLFQANGIDAKIIIPNRYLHGYGINEKSLSLIEPEGLLITVDCGVSSHACIDSLLQKGMEVLVTDHHELPDILPSCPVMNPHRADYAFSKLSGSGVAMKLALSLKERGLVLPESCYALAMLGTVADVMPLLDENRYLVKRGINSLMQGHLPNLQVLLSRLGLQQKLRASDVAFRIAPLFNAAGRLEDAALGLPLLLHEPCDAKNLSETLINMNDERKAEEQRILKEVPEPSVRDRCLIAHAKGWKTGVLGLVASRLVERHRLPVILFNEEETLKGSARSVGSFHLLNALHHVSPYLLRYGGHAQAAGLEVKYEHSESLKKELQAYCAEHLSDDMRQPVEMFLDLPLSVLTMDLLDELSLLEPYGVGNPRPVFRLQGARLYSIRNFGSKGQYRRLEMQLQDRRLVLTDFKNDLPLEIDGIYDFLFTVEANEFRGIVNLQLLLRDIRLSSIDAFSLEKHTEEMLENRGYLRPFPDRRDLAELYRRLRGDEVIAVKHVQEQSELAFALKIFEELDLISYTEFTSHLILSWNLDAPKMDLNSSSTFQRGQRRKEKQHESD